MGSSTHRLLWRPAHWIPTASLYNLPRFKGGWSFGSSSSISNNITKRAVSSKRPRVMQPARSGDVKGVWFTPSLRIRSSSQPSLKMGRYGLKRLDYKTLDPPVWTIPPHPPTKSLQERVVFPLTLVVVGGFGIWAYMNPEQDDMREYWKRVETGQILVDDEDDDDDDDDWDDDEDDDDDN